MYQVIGKTLGLTGPAAEDADLLLGVGFGAAVIGMLMLFAPDGLVIQDGDRCWVTRGGQLAAFDPQSGGWTDQRGGYPREPEMTKRDWRVYIATVAEEYGRAVRARGKEREK